MCCSLASFIVIFTVAVDLANARDNNHPVCRVIADDSRENCAAINECRAREWVAKFNIQVSGSFTK